MRQLLALAVLAITVYGIVDCSRATRAERRNLPLWLWVLLMVALPGLGALIWLTLSWLLPTAPEPVHRRPLAPDDDPDFLRSLRTENNPPSPSTDEDPPSPEADLDDESKPPTS